MDYLRLINKSLFRVDEVADYFNVSRSTVYLWLDRGILKVKKNSRTIRIIMDDLRLPNKSLFRPDEVADYFNISRSTVYLWIDHGILKAEKISRTIRISREEILSCRFNNKINLS